MVNLTAHSLFSTVEHKFSVFNDLCGKVMISKIEEVTKVYGGSGVHYVKSGAYTWEEETKIDTTW